MDQHRTQSLGETGDVGPPSQETIDRANMANMALITRSQPVSIHTTKQSFFIGGKQPLIVSEILQHWMDDQSVL